MLYQDAEGIIWLATTEGLQRIDQQTNKVTTYCSNPALPGTLSSNNVAAVYKDRTGNLWIGTDNGINKVPAHSKPFYTHQLHLTVPSVRVHDNNIKSVLWDQKGTIWLGTPKGLYRLGANFRPISHFPHNSANPKNHSSDWVTAIYEDRKGRLWVGSQEGMQLFNRATGKFTSYPSASALYSNYNNSVAEDASGKLWIVGSGIVCFNPNNNQYIYYRPNPKYPAALKDEYINGLMVSRTGDIWVATATWGVSRLDPKTGKFIHYRPSYSSPAGHINDKCIFTFYEDRQGIIWVGTLQGGLNRFDPKTNTFTYFTTREGLPSNNIKSITGDEKGNLWIATSKGISRFNPQTRTFRNFDVSDGLPDNFFNHNSFYSRRGRLLFDSINGLVAFHPDSIQDNALVPPVHLTGFRVLEQSRPLPDKQIELSYQENFLSFDFVALNYDTPEKNQYAYQLVGLDKDWIYSGNRRFASYTDLAPGEYTFRVKGSNNDGIWNEQGVSLTILIHPPWWRTWGSYLAYAMIIGNVLVLARRNIKRRERLRADLRVQQVEADKLRELDTMKSRFFANLSHEFRTPLALISGTVQQLTSQLIVPAEQKAAYGTIQRYANRLLQLINQLLDLSKLEAGQLQVHPQPGDVTGLLRSLAGSLESLAHSKGISYRYAIPLRSRWADFDADKLEKICLNLLSNTIKFTPAGGQVLFSASLENPTPTTDLLKLTVQDTGIGIPADHLPHIFDRFYQVDSSTTRSFEGTGIGLALTKDLVEMLGGTIRVESQAGGLTGQSGSTFTVLLPLTLLPQPIDTGQESTPVALEHEADLEESHHRFDQLATRHAVRVLVVEDNADLREFIYQSLSRNFSVLVAPDGQAGLKQALETIPDLVVSDVMMPGLDGLSLCEQLKSDERTSHIPVILLTAKADTHSKLSGLELGADDYLTKPFQVEELRVRITNLITQRKQLRERFARQVLVQPQDIAVTSLDERFLQRALAVVEAQMGNTDFDVEAFGREIGLSRAQLHRKLTALTGQPPNEFVRRLRLQRAAALLRERQGNVGEVALAVGFNSLNYFTRCFREQYGLAPSEYLRQPTGTNPL